ncbi:outer membrane lipoprotein carrier protein LolA [Pollutibacter soli]|uniref:LolA family protein n=1 Tax=Pollutibacter soli TaxID=3034157 RepID=UPI003013B8B9
MRNIIVTTTFCFFSTVLYAQYSGYTAVPDPAAFKEQFSSNSKKTESIQSDFTQEKTLSLLSEKINSKGKFWFKRENKVRMEYQQPFQYLLVMNQGEILIKDGVKETKVSSSSGKLIQQVNRITVDCVQGTVFSNPDFITKVFENKSGWLVEMTPVAKNMKELFKNIVVIIDKSDYAVQTVEMNELRGDQTKIRFLNKQLNAKIPDHLFAVR